MRMLVKLFSFGDKVVHTGRPEWGIGTVTSALGDVHEGRPCQKLTIRFEREGLKTISTAFAALVPAEDAPAILASDREDPADPLAMSNAVSVRELMTKLPEACTDAFNGYRVRLTATLNLYKYNEHGGSLLDWAAAQTRLKDPMSRFSRHELEELFKRFCFARDEHLKKLVWEMKKQDPQTLAELAKSAPRGAQQMLRRFDAGR
jgi:hypothetical protein